MKGEEDLTARSMKTMQRRACERVRASIKVGFNCCRTEYSGTVTNLSERGMFIHMGRMIFPFEHQFNVFMPVKEEVIKLPVEVVHMTKSGKYYNGIGVRLLDVPPSYANLVAHLRHKPQS